MSQSTERIDFNTSAAVRGDRGFSFGTAFWMMGARVMIEIDAQFEVGEAAEVRLTLAPSPGTVLLRARVYRILATAEGETSRYVFHVDHITDEDRPRFEGWLANIKTRGTYSNFDAIRSTTPLGSPGGASSAEVRLALERLSHRGTVSGAPGADPFGLRSDVIDGTSSGRAAMRDALRKAVAVGPSAPPEQAQPPRTSVQTASPATSPTPTPVARQPAEDPAYASTSTRHATWLEVRWASPGAFAEDIGAMLANDLLSLPNLGVELPDREPLHVMLRHQSASMDCGATVVSHGPFGAEYRLLLDPIQRALAREWIGHYGTK